MAGRQRNFQGTRGPRRLVEWDEGPKSSAIQSVTVAGATTVTLGKLFVTKETIVRVRGMLTLWLEVATTIGDGYSDIVAAIGVVSNDAFTAGGAAIPNPVGDAQWSGWLWYQNIGPIIGQSVTESENTGALSQVRIPIDSKAMRKVSPNDAIFGVVESVTEVGTATLNFFMSTRMLIKLS